jgi:hypothetical protein
MQKSPLTDQNYLEKILRFEDRQAGVSVIFDPHTERFSYNAYCLETQVMKELFSVEHDYLDDALELINSEFGAWELVDLSAKNSGCGSCAAK